MRNIVSIFLILSIFLVVLPQFVTSSAQILGPTAGSTPCASPASTNPDLQKIFGSVNAPSQLQNLFGCSTPEVGISNVLSLVIQLLYVVASIVFVFYLLYSGLQFIYSEGSKESVSEAKGRITWAIVGIIFMALVFVLLRIISIVTGFTFFN